MKLRKISWIILLLLLGFSAPSLQVSARQTRQTPARQTRIARTSANLIMVKLHPNEDINRINNAYRTITVDDRLSFVNVYLLHPTYDAIRTAQRLERDSRVSLVEFNRNESLVDEIIYADPSDAWAWGGFDPGPTINSQTSRQMLGINTAHTMSFGDNITVAVLDTGVQIDHPYLSRSLVAGYDFVDGDDDPDDELPMSDRSGAPIMTASGHGTHVAGLIHYVAPRAKIMPLRVLETNGGGDIFTIISAVIYAVENDADVINLSLGTAIKSVLLKDILDNAIDEGIIVVAAAGNNADAHPQYPAAFDGVISVASIDDEYKKSAFSSYGEWVDLVAPGEGAFSAYPTDGYAWWSGTSMATALVSGQFALIKSAAPDIDLGDYIEDSAFSVDAQNPTFQDNLGLGVLDAGVILNLLDTPLIKDLD